MFSKKMLPSKSKSVMPHEGKSINRKVGLIRGQKNKSERSHVVLRAKELIYEIDFLSRLASEL